MSYEHHLEATIHFKPGVTDAQFFQAIAPLMNVRNWTKQMVRDQLAPNDDATTLALDSDGHVTSFSLYTTGNVLDQFADVVQEFADNLELIAKAGKMELHDYSSGDLAAAIQRFWYGAPYEVEAARQLHACDGVLQLLRDGGMPEDVIGGIESLINDFKATVQ